MKYNGKYNEKDFQQLNKLESHIYGSKKPKKSEMLEFIRRFNLLFSNFCLLDMLFNSLKAKTIYKNNLYTHLTMMMLIIDPKADLNLSLKEKLAYVYLFS